jgi:hypothetical protein
MHRQHVRLLCRGFFIHVTAYPCKGKATVQISNRTWGNSARCFTFHSATIFGLLIEFSCCKMQETATAVSKLSNFIVPSNWLYLYVILGYQLKQTAAAVSLPFNTVFSHKRYLCVNRYQENKLLPPTAEPPSLSSHTKDISVCFRVLVELICFIHKYQNTIHVIAKVD